MITQPIKNVKLLSMAESEGHDPYSEVNRNVLLIGHTPTLWDSLSNHKLIIALCHKKTILAILAIIVIGIPLLYLTVLNQKEYA